ncbi:glucoamylase [Luteolibacter pohnpeiensis]|uniref:Glucoamylase n=1 Tax=Luteolibacter pohnpeiensis TaxID=454153 RepID=A0A934VW08_9BACT|nr:glycoside hydrolase family 15 protein [Luteolibacter pohnpeiensis]MBK1882034.1 glucoamylase [Luteolibacter pohnpeiensis]
MSHPSSSIAFGAPGIEPRWTSSAKIGVGTAYSSSSNVWFTLSHGIVNEIYYPHVDLPNTRDLQFLISDGETFCHQESTDMDHEVEYPEENVLFYRLINRDRGGRYRIIKEILGEPHSPVLLVHTKLEILDPSYEGKLRMYVLLAPHVKGTGRNNNARWEDVGGRNLLHAYREEIHLMLGCHPDFSKRSVGFVGASDGWRDLMDNFQMDWEFQSAVDGNLALTAEVDLTDGLEFTVGVGFGYSQQSASTQLLQAFATPFDQLKKRYFEQWQRTRNDMDLASHTGDGASMVRLSKCVLLAHEDKIFPGASVASLSIPWGEIKDDSDRGGYHLVWTRDMVHTATALLACGETESPLRALIWLSCVQAPDGCLPQNSGINGAPYWQAIQLDEVAAPILLAWRLLQHDALRDFDPRTVVFRAARFLILNGPVTGQERWEENAGYSPSTLASLIAGLVGAAEFASRQDDDETARILLDHADWLEANLEKWTTTKCGELLEGTPKHYIRITPADPGDPVASPDPDTVEIHIANGGGIHPARNVISGDFLQLVRLGIRDASDPLIVDSIAVLDHVLKRELPQGPSWRRYNHDGYGQNPDGTAFDGTGEGRCWVILTGERGHYELAAGKDPLPFIQAIEDFANEGGMLPEQLWDAEDLPDGKMKMGAPTGSAMPLCWSHAEYLALVNSRRNGVCFDRMEPVYQRYVANRVAASVSIWTLSHQLQSVDPGQKMRVVLDQAAMVRFSTNDWNTHTDLELVYHETLDLWWVDLPTSELKSGTLVRFTFCWKQGNHWENRNFHFVLR